MMVVPLQRGARARVGSGNQWMPTIHEQNIPLVSDVSGDNEAPTASRVQAAVFFFSSRRRHTRCLSDWSSDVCSSDLAVADLGPAVRGGTGAADVRRGADGRGRYGDGTARPAGIALDVRTVGRSARPADRKSVV